MHPDSWKRLEDTRAAGERIQRFVAGHSRSEFSASELLQSAVERQLEIIGESLGRAAQDDAELERMVPYLRKIVGLRNRLIHGYDAVDQDLVWDITQTYVPALLDQIEGLLRAGE